MAQKHVESDHKGCDEQRHNVDVSRGARRDNFCGAPGDTLIYVRMFLKSRDYQKLMPKNVYRNGPQLQT